MINLTYWAFRKANAAEFSGKKLYFYPVKGKILLLYAEYDHFDLQTIVKKCWCGDGWHRKPQPPDFHGEECFKCLGTGTYDTREVILKRYIFRGQVWHTPASSDKWRVTDLVREEAKTTIQGYIRHDYVAYWIGIWATLYLLLLYDRKNVKPFWSLSFDEWWYWKKRKARWGYEQVRSYIWRILKNKDKKDDEIPF